METQVTLLRSNLANVEVGHLRIARVHPIGRHRHQPLGDRPRPSRRSVTSKTGATSRAEVAVARCLGGRRRLAHSVGVRDGSAAGHAQVLAQRRTRIPARRRGSLAAALSRTRDSVERVAGRRARRVGSEFREAARRSQHEKQGGHEYTSLHATRAFALMEALATAPTTWILSNPATIKLTWNALVFLNVNVFLKLNEHVLLARRPEPRVPMQAHVQFAERG